MDGIGYVRDRISGRVLARAGHYSAFRLGLAMISPVSSSTTRSSIFVIVCGNVYRGADIGMHWRAFP